MTKAPAFQFYAADYLADERVQLMTLEEEGIYIRLIAYCWREGSIPADAASLARLCKGASVVAMANPMSCFIQHKRDASRLVHPRLEKERKKKENFREKMKVAGKKGASNRWKQEDSLGHRVGHEQAIARPMALDSSSSSSSSSASAIKETDYAGGRNLVILPTLDQAKAFAPSAGVPPDVAETWWHECEARPLTPQGEFTDRDGNPIRKWQSHLTTYGRKWQSNNEQRNQGKRTPKTGTSQPSHNNPDAEL